jgi:hypothetical protein
MFTRYRVCKGEFQEDEQLGFCKPATSQDACPWLSKYNVFAVPKVMANCEEVVLALGVALRSARTAAMMLVAAVCDVAFRFVCTPTGIRPKIAIREKAAIPRARVTSTRENAAARFAVTFIFYRF